MRVDGVDVSCFTIPTDQPESDGTLEWSSTTIVVVEARSGAVRGLGYTYAPEAAGKVVEGQLRDVVVGRTLDEHAAVWLECGAQLRNAGRPGIAFCALSALDVALWDLRARLLDVPLVSLLPAAHDRVPIYGSGGFCSYTLERLQEQLGSWADEGIPRVKMKLGREPDFDPQRIDAAREAIGDGTELYVDANGAFSAKEAVRWARRYVEEWDVRWFEEPVSSADFEGLRLVRGLSTLDVAAGEYAYVLADFRNLVGCVDCLQADVTRCGGITGLLRVNGLAAAHGLDVSGHCAPQLAAHALCGVDRLRHLEYFHDHVRIEHMLFDGVLAPDGGALVPDRSRPGLGLELKRADAQRYAA
ncbi:MAG TPA: enolase C-terminal domain-like protein [Gaiellaceae bacterium]|nr:enolase C-terminal domain-like protein [Gaiellaceae bacterium]